MANEEIMQDMKVAEALVVIGHNKDGIMCLNTALESTAAIALLENMKMSLLRQINFNKERRVVPATGVVPPIPLRPNGNGKRF